LSRKYSIAGLYPPEQDGSAENETKQKIIKRYWVIGLIHLFID
jgi:hypothetical protein